MKIRALLCFLFCFFVPLSAFSFPQNPAPLVDEAHVLSDQTRQKIVSLLEANKWINLVVVTVPSLEGKSIEQYATELGNLWGIGDKEKNDGLLLLLAPNERLVRLAVGTGMEKILPQSRTDAVIAKMIPSLKNNDFNSGMLIGVNATMQAVVDSLLEQQKPIPIWWSVGTFVFLIGVMIWVMEAPEGERGKRIMIAVTVVSVILLILWKIIQFLGKFSGGNRFGGGSFGGGGSTGRF